MIIDLEVVYSNLFFTIQRAVLPNLIHVWQVLSLKLDDWTDEQVDSFVKIGGNIEANKKFEACMPANLKKPKPDSSIDERSEFIR